MNTEKFNGKLANYWNGYFLKYYSKNRKVPTFASEKKMEVVCESGDNELHDEFITEELHKYIDSVSRETRAKIFYFMLDWFEDELFGEIDKDDLS